MSDFTAASLNELAGTDVEAVIDAACQQGFCKLFRTARLCNAFGVGGRE